MEQNKAEETKKIEKTEKEVSNRDPNNCDLKKIEKLERIDI